MGVFEISPDDILTFWIESGPKRWWKKDPAFDASIRNRFGELHGQAANGVYDHWEAHSPDAALALIIVLDQFSRNLYRGSAAAYACDAKAVSVVHRMIANGDDRQLPGGIGSFVYMPLKHSENLADQNLSVAEAERMKGARGLASAKRHRDIIVRFSRFPHRNVLLGRLSTPEELLYLENGGFAG